jgi:hypothetical protein
MSAGVVEIVLENGVSVFGFMGSGKAAAAVLDEQMRGLVVGRSVLETEPIQEHLYRASIFCGRGGFTQSIISALDIALREATPFAEYVDTYRGATNNRVLTDDPRPQGGAIKLSTASLIWLRSQLRRPPLKTAKAAWRRSGEPIMAGIRRRPRIRAETWRGWTSVTMYKIFASGPRGESY